MVATVEVTWTHSSLTSLDRLVRVAQRLVQGRAALIFVCDADGIEIVGREGIEWQRLPSSWSVGFLDPGGAEIAHVANVRRDPRFRKHPFLEAMPTLRRLIYLPLAIDGTSSRGGLVLFDPELKWPPGPETARSLRELAGIAAAILAEGQQFATAAPTAKVVPSSGGFDEVADNVPASLCPVSRFLLDRLPARAKWRVRNGHGFATLRTWRASLKPYQISSIRFLKEQPNPALVEAIAAEMAAAAGALLGVSNITAVVHVPCGHSKTAHCFSEVVARAVSRAVDAPHIDAFERRFREGSSHPSQSARLTKPKLLRQVQGTVLLIDDIASSGRNIELAAATLAPHADHVAALAWIGEK